MSFPSCSGSTFSNNVCKPPQSVPEKVGTTADIIDQLIASPLFKMGAFFCWGTAMALSFGGILILIGSATLLPPVLAVVPYTAVAVLCVFIVSLAIHGLGGFN